MTAPLQALRRMSGTKAANERGDLGPTQLNREKGLWNFLTWSYFIAQVLAAEKFLASSARAADLQDANFSSLPSQLGDNPSKYLEPLAAVRRPEVDSQDVRHGAAADAVLNIGFKGPSDSHFTDPTTIVKATDPVFGVDVYADGDGELHDRTGDTSLVGSVTGLAELPLANDLAASVLNLDMPLGDIFASSRSTVSDLTNNAIGGFEQAVESASATVGDISQSVVLIVDQTLTHLLEAGLPLSPVTTALNTVTQGPLGTADAIVGSAGSLAFPAVPAIADLAHNLFGAEGYTPLGLTLGKEALSGSPVDAAVSPATGPIETLVGHILGGDSVNSPAYEAQPHTPSHNIIALPSHLDNGLLHGLA